MERTNKKFLIIMIIIMIFVFACSLINLHSNIKNIKITKALLSDKVLYKKEFAEYDFLDRFLLQYYGENSFQELLNNWSPELKFTLPISSDLAEVKKELDNLLTDFLARNLILCTNQIFDLPSSGYPKLTITTPIDLDTELRNLNNFAYSEKEELRFSLLNDNSKSKISLLDIIQNIENGKDLEIKVNRDFLEKIDILSNKIVLIPPEERYYFKIRVEKDNKNIILTFTDFNLPEKKTKESFMAYNVYGKFP